MASTYYTYYEKRHKVEKPKTKDDLIRLKVVALNSPSVKIRQAIYDLFKEIGEFYPLHAFVVVGTSLIEIDQDGKPRSGSPSCTYKEYLYIKNHEKEE